MKVSWGTSRFWSSPTLSPARCWSAQNLPAIRKALEEGGNKHFEIDELPGLNHLFQTAKTGSPVEYA
jgi:hypothetical protein